MYALPNTPVVLLLLLMVLGLPTVVIHELGHGIAANVVAKVPVLMAVVVAGPLASLAQGVCAVWLSTALNPGTGLYAVVAVFGLAGLMAGVLNLVPLRQPDLQSDGQTLLDLTRLVAGGRVADWIVLARGAEDPHAATSVAPPG